MTKFHYKPYEQGNTYSGSFDSNEHLRQVAELRALLENPKRMMNIDQLIGNMLHGQPMPQTGMPAPYHFPMSGHVEMSGAEPFTMRPQDIPTMFQHTNPKAWQSRYPLLVPDQQDNVAKPMPNPAFGQKMPQMLGRPLLRGPADLILGPDSVPLAQPRPPGLELPQGMKVGPDGEMPVPDTFYNIPEDPEAEDV